MSLEEKIVPVEIVDQMEESFLQYSMSVIVSRALPDVRDGLKPVHRRILYTMYEKNLLPENPYRKCADTVSRCWVLIIPTATRLYMTRWCVWRRIFRCAMCW